MLGNDDINYVEKLTELFNESKINHFYDQKLVRGLDYYDGLVFEVYLNQNKNAILGGGRYNQLFKNLGNIDIPASGFALGIDRLVNFLCNLDK